MRFPFGAVTCAWLSLAACGSNAVPGAYLDVKNIPANATEIEVVLAGSAQVAPSQHTGAGFDAVEDARYYAQRGSTGPLATTGAREMVVLIEPSMANTNLTTELTPIVLARTTAGDDTTLVAFATIPGTGDLLQMQLATATVDEYAATMEQAAPLAAAAGGLAPGERETFECAAEGLAGFAWRAADGSQIRVVRPLGDPAGDASTLPLDLDCDGIAATDGDCDDLASTVYAGAPEVCDGVDSDCAQDPKWVGSCEVVTPVDGCVAPVGRDVCDELVPHESACVEIPTALCPTPGAFVCVVDRVALDAPGLCDPDIGLITLDPTICPNGSCAVEAPAVQSANWHATVAADAGGPYGSSTVTTHQGQFLLQIEQTASGPPGVIDLFVTSTGSSPIYFGVSIQKGTGTCQGAPDGAPDGTFQMQCAAR